MVKADGPLNYSGTIDKFNDRLFHLYPPPPRSVVGENIKQASNPYKTHKTCRAIDFIDACIKLIEYYGIMYVHR